MFFRERREASQARLRLSAFLGRVRVFYLVQAVAVDELSVRGDGARKSCLGRPTLRHYYHGNSPRKVCPCPNREIFAPFHFSLRFVHLALISWSHVHRHDRFTQGVHERVGFGGGEGVICARPDEPVLGSCCFCSQRALFFFHSWHVWALSISYKT